MDLEGNFHSVYPLKTGLYIASYQKSQNELLGLYEFDPMTNSLGKEIYSDDGFYCIEPVMVSERPPPRKLPSRVDTKIGRGYYVCLDSDYSMEPANIYESSTKTQTVEVLGLEGKIIDVQVQEDGSFYLELPPDMPVRFLTRNENGDILRGPSAWTWVRSNERRGCIG